MKNLLFIMLSIMLIMACTEPANDSESVIIKTETIIKDSTTEFCNYEVMNDWCYNINANIWFELDLNSYTNGQATIELQLYHVGGDITENIQVYAKKYNTNETPINDYASYDGNVGILRLNTDENGKISIMHTWSVDETRKINLIIKLTMVRK